MLKIRNKEKRILRTIIIIKILLMIKDRYESRFPYYMNN